MAQTIQLKRSSVAGNLPTSSDLALGEIAINTADGAVYIKKGNNDIVAVADNDILHIDTTNTRIGIGTTTPAKALQVKTDTNGDGVNIQRNSTTADHYGQLSFSVSTNDSYTTPNVWIRGVRVSSYTNNFMTIGTGGNTGTEAMRIDSSQQVGIGLTSPSEKLHIYGTGATISGKVEAGDGNQASLDLKNSEGEFRLICDGGELSIFDQTDSTERFRINTSGVVTVGVSTFADGTGGTSIAGGLVKISNDSTSNGTQMFFTNPNGAVGSISSSGSATAFNTSSDARLKDVTGSARGLEVINELNPVAYNWKVDGKTDEGLIAQEVLDVVPNAVSGSEEDMYQMDYSKLVTHLVKAVQEQQEQIESLKSEIANLKEN